MFYQPPALCCSNDRKELRSEVFELNLWGIDHRTIVMQKANNVFFTEDEHLFSDVSNPYSQLKISGVVFNYKDTTSLIEDPILHPEDLQPDKYVYLIIQIDHTWWIHSFVLPEPFHPHIHKGNKYA